MQREAGTDRDKGGSIGGAWAQKLIKFTFILEKALENARLMRPSHGDDADGNDDDAKGS